MISKILHILPYTAFFNHMKVSEAKINQLAGMNKKVFWFGGSAHGRVSATNTSYDQISFGSSLSGKFSYLNMNLIVPELLVDATNITRTDINRKIREHIIDEKEGLSQRIDELRKYETLARDIELYANGDKKLLLNNTSNRVTLKGKDINILIKQQKSYPIINIVEKPTDEDLKPYISIEQALYSFKMQEMSHMRHMNIYFDNCSPWHLRTELNGQEKLLNFIPIFKIDKKRQKKRMHSFFFADDFKIGINKLKVTAETRYGKATSDYEFMFPEKKRIYDR